METKQLVHFRKEIVSNRVMVNGVIVPFEELDGNRGVIVLDPARDKAMIDGLNAIVGKLGVLKISAEEYEEVKKNHPYNPSAKQSSRNAPLRVMPTSRPNPLAPVAEPAAADPTPPAPPAPQQTSPPAPANPPPPPEKPPVPSAPAPTAETGDPTAGRFKPNTRRGPKPQPNVSETGEAQLSMTQPTE